MYAERAANPPLAAMLGDANLLMAPATFAGSERIGTATIQSRAEGALVELIAVISGVTRRGRKSPKLEEIPQLVGGATAGWRARLD
jgi:hypothetical protein